MKPNAKCPPIVCHALLVLLIVTSMEILYGAPPLKFSFIPGQSDASYIQISKTSNFSEQTGYGIDFQQSKDQDFSKSTFSGKFSVLLDEGNYDIKANFGHSDAPTETTLKVEDRRVMLSQVKTKPGEIFTQTFTLNIRTPAIPGADPVKINRRESGPPVSARWDGKLTLECVGPLPGLRTLEISRNDAAVTISLAGDSTVTEQADEPYAGWGQMLPLFFQPGIAIANHAESGLALNSFRSKRRLEKIIQTLKPGDYVFIQFGHNDQKETTPGSGPYTTYRERLKAFIHDIAAKKGQPVLVTPMERRRFKDGQPYATLHEFAAAARQTAQEEKVPLIDLNAMSLQLYGALGREESRKAFVHYPAGTFPGQEKKLEDDTHHNAYGGMQLAKCVIEGIRRSVPELATHLRPGTLGYDPLHPDPPDEFKLPASLLKATAQPAGN